MASNDLARQVLDLANKFTYATGMTPNVVIVGPNVDPADLVVGDHTLLRLRIIADDLAPNDLSVAYTV